MTRTEAPGVVNREVAEKVMGETLWVEQRGGYEYIIVQHEGEREPWFAYQNGEKRKANYSRLEVPINEMKHIVTPGLKRYSTRIEDAWLVVERMLELGWRIEIGSIGEQGEWYCAMAGPLPDPLGLLKSDQVLLASDVCIESGTAPEAICRAALAAMEVKA